MSLGLEKLLLDRVLSDRYRVEEVIGRGGMSVVYRAIDERLNRPVAVKVVALPAASDEQRAHLRERFRREAGSAARIPHHPNVVQVFDYGTDPALDLDFLVMELLHGRDLKEAIAQRQLTQAQAVRVVREAARGVAAGHRAGIVHRDVKPANIFLQGEHSIEAVRILDFGIAKALEVTPDDDLTLANELPHSPAYASPEQMEQGRPIDPASDVFSLGLVAFEVLTGQRPFSIRERDRLRAGEVVPPPPIAEWERVPAALRKPIERALHPDPRKRFPDAAAFAEALAEPIEDDATQLLSGAAVTPIWEDDETALVDVPAAPAPAASSDADPVLPSAKPAPVAAPRRGRRAWLQRNIALVAVAGAALMLGIWVLAQGTWATATPQAEPTTTALDTRGLDAEFRELFSSAYGRLAGELGSASGEDAAEAVQRVIIDLYDAWTHQQFDRHMTHYAERVDFYGNRRYTRSRIERERRDAREQYSDVEVSIDRQAIEFPEPGTARAIVDVSWHFRGPESEWEGAAQQEFMLRLAEGRWLIESERELALLRSERTDR